MTPTTAASQHQPLVLVLEHLHDADRGTLDLLMHLSRNLQDLRLVLLGTYHDVEVDRTHPLSGTLAELRRSSHFLRLPLRGLTTALGLIHTRYAKCDGSAAGTRLRFRISGD